MKDLLVNGIVKRSLNRHRQRGKRNVFLFGTPRGGSTWLMEMIWSQPGFKTCNEPLDLRNPLVRKHLRISDWEELYSKGAEEKLESYFRRFNEGRLYIVDPLPGRGKYHRFLTDRTVFKVIHGAEDRISFLADRFDGKVVLLLRHPIPVSLSRRVLPRLEAFLNSDYRRHFSSRELSVAEEVSRSGSDLERGVLDWCLQTAVPLRQAHPDWSIVTYEQLVLEPDKVLPSLARDLDLPEPGRMERHLTVASKVTNQSDRETRSLLEMGGTKEVRRKLVEKWRGKVTGEEESRAMGILQEFGLDIYSAGDALPTRYWLGGEPKEGEAADDLPLTSTNRLSSASRPAAGSRE